MIVGHKKLSNRQKKRGGGHNPEMGTCGVKTATRRELCLKHRHLLLLETKGDPEKKQNPGPECVLIVFVDEEFTF